MAGRILRFTGGMLIVSLGLVPILLVLRVLHIEPLTPWVCLTPTPSGANVAQALKDGMSEQGYAWDDRVTLSVRRLECPHWVGVGTPKQTFWLRISANAELISEGQLAIGYDHGHVIPFVYLPAQRVMPALQANYPVMQAFLTTYSP